MFSEMSDEALKWGMPPYDEARIDRWLSGIENLIALVAVHEGRVVGYTATYKHTHPRLKGIGEMGIYIHQDFHSIGLGTVMTKRALGLAEEQGLHRIGLEVVEENRAAAALYKKMGFNGEGTRKDAYYGSDGEYHNLVMMGKILSK